VSDSKRRLAIWGSSVAAGAGDESEQGGYAGRLGRLLQADGWQVFNQSLGGDNTASLALRFAPGESNYVVIGLSLGNEGISQSDLARTHRWSESDDEAAETFEQFASGLRHLINRSRDAGIMPIVTSPYARGDFSPQEYAHTLKMNLLINSWDVPSVNLLGAIDDGHGRWTDGFWADPFHPNSAGHHELGHAFVPSLFAALEAGKPVPSRIVSSGCTLGGESSPPLVFAFDDTIRSFSLTFQVQAHDDDTIATVRGRTLDARASLVHRSWNEWEWESETLELVPADHYSDAILAVCNGHLSYLSSTGQSVIADNNPLGRDWHDVTLTHYVARGETLLYLDAKLVGTVAERLQPDEFTLGSNSVDAKFRNWMIHRAGLTLDEVIALHNGRLLQASLELYAPLSRDGYDVLQNVAQSLSVIKKTPRR
jgi:lysophospholipase L1-like esterase